MDWLTNTFSSVSSVMGSLISASGLTLNLNLPTNTNIKQQQQAIAHSTKVIETLPHDTRVAKLRADYETYFHTHSTTTTTTNTNANGHQYDPNINTYISNSINSLSVSIDATLKNSIQTAVRSGDSTSVIQSIASQTQTQSQSNANVSTNAISAAQYALLLAVHHRQAQVCSAILSLCSSGDKGKNKVTELAKARTTDGLNLLHIAVASKEDNSAVLNMLLAVPEFAALLNQRDRLNFNSHFHVATMPPVGKEVGVANVNVNASIGMGLTPWLFASLNGASWAIPILLTKMDPRGINAVDMFGNNALLLSYASGSSNLVVPGNSSVNAVAASLFSCLDGSGNQNELMKLINTPNKERLLPIHAVAENGDEATLVTLILQQLTDKTATSLNENVIADNRTNNFGFLSGGGGVVSEEWTPLLFACESGNISCVRTLLESNTSGSIAAIVTSSSQKYSVTALHVAAFYGRSDIVQYLLSKGANPNALTTEGGSALAYACIVGNIDTVRTLLEVTSQTNYLSAVMTAIKRQTPQSFLCAQRILLKALHAHDTSVDYMPALKLAVDCNLVEAQKEMYDILLANVNLKTDIEKIVLEGKDLLVYSAERRNAYVVKQLIDRYNFGEESVSIVKKMPGSATLLGLSDVGGSGIGVSKQCVCCYEKPSVVKFSPCGHVQCCKLCAQLLMRADPRCPMCRKQIDSLQ